MPQKAGENISHLLETNNQAWEGTGNEVSSVVTVVVACVVGMTVATMDGALSVVTSCASKSGDGDLQEGKNEGEAFI